MCVTRIEASETLVTNRNEFSPDSVTVCLDGVRGAETPENGGYGGIGLAGNPLHRFKESI